MSEWRPIETAPMNDRGKMSGPFVLVFCGYDHVIRQARWTVSLIPYAAMRWCDFEGKDISGKRPTHWMLRPDPPSDDDAEPAEEWLSLDTTEPPCV